MAELQNGLKETIEDVATGLKSHEIDGEKQEHHSLPDLIQADKYLASKRAAKNPMGAMKMFKIAAPGGR